MISFIYVTCPDLNEAKSLARTLLDEKIIGCANIFPGMISIYPWEGEVKSEDEVALILKTPSAQVKQVLDRVNKLHSYENPCALEIPTGQGLKAYQDWLTAETSP